MFAHPSARLIVIDHARTLALLGMITFHFRFDLVIFGLAPPEITATPFFYWHARIVAGAFLALAGLSLWLAHGKVLKWPAFWRREAKIVLAAGLVSLATYFAIPQSWIFFGILHSIALGSLLALPALRLPAPVTLACGVVVVVGSYFLPPLVEWNHPVLRWIGLQTLQTNTMDLEPLFPWFGVLLIGLAFGRAMEGRWPQPKSPPSRTSRALAWPGRHSLVIYLVHQPIMMALIWLALQLR
jgi:uncharacterized membrane protein